MSSYENTDPVASVIIITLGRQSLYELLPVLRDQEVDFPFEIVLIANGPVDENKIEGNSVRVFHEESGKGIPYYRNAGSNAARGRILVHTDDDIVPRDRYWLSRLVTPILEGDEKVTVAGTYIPQGQGFMADLISMLGYPGGGSLGWRAVYNVDENGYTDKLPSANCALERSALEEVGGFHEGLPIGTSDVYLGEVLLEHGFNMLYVDDATVIHEARGDLAGFLRWQVRRGRALYDFHKIRPISQFQRKHVSGRLRRTWLILKSTFPTTKFIPMLGILMVEYFCHALGYGLQMIERGGVKERLSRGWSLARGKTP